MKDKLSLLTLPLVAALAFYAGTAISNTSAQSQDVRRDAQGRFVPTPKYPFPPAKSSLGVTGDIAFRVGNVTPGSPAQQLGLQSGDLIVRIDGKQFYSINDWMQLLAEKNPGEEVTVEYVRFGDDSCPRERKSGKAEMAPLNR
jgi:S1-C subfamily serine protease